MRASATVDLTSAYIDVEYIGTIGVGTPPQYFSMDFDTGSSDIWIPSEDCTTCGNHTLFEYDKSSSALMLNSSWSLRYGDGSGVQGYTAADNIVVQDDTVKNVTIGLVFSESSDFSRDGYLDGIFGLAFPALSYTDLKKPFVEMMYDQKLIDEAIVGVWLGRSQDGGYGEINFGGTSSEHYEGDFTYIPVTEKRYWQVRFDGITLGNRTYLSPQHQSAIIDTGTTLTVLPIALSRRLHEQIPGAVYNDSYGWRVPCNTTSDLVVDFLLGNQSFPVNATDLIRERSSPKQPDLCFSGVAEADSPLVIMGDTFLHSYYSVYDYANARIGFAPARRP
ncbi:peptidase A1 [Hesseltinella vesiculosa]|uniref:rhizopuspepsin n=1 Tax=Hesseltinella vesiculosa TaxID=101127 RepID=A0A1X2GF27_9FUNG|nr:peptidase A1 [Hesseltinella vesiculosa]